MNAPENLAGVVVLGGFGLAFAFGVVASKTNFCTMGAISDVVNMGHWGRMRMWLLAIAVALISANALHLAGLVDLSKAIYLRPTLPWLSLLVGGLCFGVGMTLASGCANKNLLRLGGGSIRSMVVLTFLAIAAYMTLKGLFAQWRAALLDPVSLDLSRLGASDQGLPTLLSSLTGLTLRSATVLCVALIGGGLLLFALKDARFRRNLKQVVGGAILGLLVAAGWYVTGHLGYGENPDTLEIVYFGTNTRTLESLSFVAPAAYTLELLLLWTDKSLGITFGIASAVGVVLGSFAYALATRSFRWEGFASLADLRNHILGGVMMGFGGVSALGCTVGQGMSGLSTLALGSVIAILGIATGAVLTMNYLNWRESNVSSPEPLPNTR
jgi:uncharacterized membrane protein YedE/YeeE